MSTEYNRALRWSYLSAIVYALLQIASTAIMARYVAPVEYGLVALALLCGRFTTYFAQLGMGRALIQKSQLQDVHVRAAFTSSMALGIAASAITCALAPILARFFRQPRLGAVLLVYSATFILQAAAVVPGALLRRRLEMKRLAFMDTLSFLLGAFTVGAPMAVAGFGVWSVLGSQLAQQLFTAILYFWHSPHNVRPTFCLDHYRPMLGFGTRVTLLTVVQTAGMTADTFLLGRLASGAALGVYNRSFLLMALPVQFLSDAMMKVMYTKLCRAAAEGRQRAGAALEEGERLWTSILFPVCAGAAASAPAIVLSVLGPSWSDAISTFRIQCLSVGANASWTLLALYLESIARFRYIVLIQTGYVVLVVCAIVLAAPRGIVAVAGSVAAVECVRTMFLWMHTADVLGRPPALLLRSCLPGFQAACLVAASTYAAQRLFGLFTSTPVLNLAACILIAGATLFTFFALAHRETVLAPLADVAGLRGVRSRLTEHRLDAAAT